MAIQWNSASVKPEVPFAWIAIQPLIFLARRDRDIEEVARVENALYRMHTHAHSRWQVLPAMENNNPLARDAKTGYILIMACHTSPLLAIAPSTSGLILLGLLLRPAR